MCQNHGHREVELATALWSAERARKKMKCLTARSGSSQCAVVSVSLCALRGLCAAGWRESNVETSS